MPWKDPAKNRAYRKVRYKQKVEAGEVRDWGTVKAVCPVCSKERELSKNRAGITKQDKDPEGRIIQRCRSCSKRKDYAPWMDTDFVVEYQQKLRRGQKIKSIQHLGGSCLDCNLAYNGSNAYAFDFHHLDPSQKDFSPGGKFKKWEKVLIELEKCVLLCAICHRARHTESY